MCAARSEYVRLCSERRVKPLKTLLKQLPRENEDADLASGVKVDLSGVNLTVKMCAVIGKMLGRDRSILAVYVADCYISEEGCLALCSYLAENVTLRGLSLKGNNLRTKSASALSTVLKQTKSIESLALEWNSLGTDEEAFAMLMEGLAVNETLVHLDLRNNHITHLGARQLATALMQNDSLQEVDMSWNNCGLVGGRLLLDALQHNRSLAVLNLTGNSIPDDVAGAISLSLQRNVDRHTLESTYSARTQHLTHALDQQMVSKKREISSVLDKLEAQRSAFDAALESSQDRIVELQRDLMLRSEEIAELQARHESTEVALRVSEEQASQFKAFVERLRSELAETQASHSEEMKAEKQRFSDFQTEADTASCRAIDTADTLTAKVNELERYKKQLLTDVRCLQDDKQQLLLRIQKTETEFQSQRLAHDKRHTIILQEQEQQAQEGLSRQRHAASGREHSLQEQIRHSETKCTHMEQELSRLKAASLSAREALVADQKAQLEQVKSEHKVSVRHFEEKIQQLQVEMDTKQAQVVQATSSANQLQARLTALTQEAAAEQQAVQLQVKKLETLVEDHTKDAAKERKGKRSAQKQMEEAEERCRCLEQEIDRGKTRMSDLETHHLTKLSSKEREISTLTDRAEDLSQQLHRQREAELKRASQLEAAISAFVSSTKSAA